MANGDETQPQKATRIMHKRIEKKEDGRLLIYYTFGQAEPATTSATSKPEDARK